MNEALNSLIKRAATLRDIRRVMSLKLHNNKNLFRTGVNPNRTNDITAQSLISKQRHVADDAAQQIEIGTGVTLPAPPNNPTSMAVVPAQARLAFGPPEGDTPALLAAGNPSKIWTSMGAKPVKGSANKELSNRLVYLHELHEIQEMARTARHTPNFFTHVTPGVLLKDRRLMQSLPKEHKEVVDAISAVRSGKGTAGVDEYGALRKYLPEIDRVKLNSKNIPRISDIIEGRVQRGLAASLAELNASFANIPGYTKPKEDLVSISDWVAQALKDMTKRVREKRLAAGMKT